VEKNYGGHVSRMLTFPGKHFGKKNMPHNGTPNPSSDLITWCWDQHIGICPRKTED